MRKSANLVVASSMILLSATLAGAQAPQPSGMLSPTNPALLTMDGMPDGNGDVPVTIAFVAPPTGGQGFLEVMINCNGGFSLPLQAAASQNGMPFDGFGRVPDEVMIDQFDTSDAMHPRPIGAAFAESGQAGGNVGMAMMVDSDGNHQYERLMVQGTKGGMPVAAELDLRSADRNQDGFPEYVTLFDPAAADPMYNLGVLQFFGWYCNNEMYDQVWLPVARDLDNDAAIIGDLDGDGIADPEFYWGPKLQIASTLLQVPTLSGLGLAALAALLLLVGLRLMRRRGLAAGV